MKAKKKLKMVWQEKRCHLESKGKHVCSFHVRTRSLFLHLYLGNDLVQSHSSVYCSFNHSQQCGSLLGGWPNTTDVSMRRASPEISHKMPLPGQFRAKDVITAKNKQNFITNSSRTDTSLLMSTGRGAKRTNTKTNKG